jgi:hypothetical protein
VHCRLAEALTYSNPEVVQRLLNKCKYSFTREEAQTLFEDTLRWLWLNAKANHAPELFIEDRQDQLDEGWHNFLIFSGAYRSFCQTYLGKLIVPPVSLLEVGRVRCQKELGVMLNYYYRDAA